MWETILVFLHYGEISKVAKMSFHENVSSFHDRRAWQLLHWIISLEITINHFLYYIVITSNYTLMFKAQDVLQMQTSHHWNMLFYICYAMLCCSSYSTCSNTITCSSTFATIQFVDNRATNVNCNCNCNCNWVNCNQRNENLQWTLFLGDISISWTKILLKKTSMCRVSLYTIFLNNYFS